MAQHHNISVAQVKKDPDSVSFSRWLVGIWKDQWDSILTDLSLISLNNNEDVVSWKFGSKGLFSVKSVYNALSVNEAGPHYKKIWKSKMPAKIQIFMWLVLNKAILTKDNMIKREWQGDPACYFCSSPETVSHLLSECNTAKAVWATFASCIGALEISCALRASWCKILFLLYVIRVHSCIIGQDSTLGLTDLMLKLLNKKSKPNPPALTGGEPEQHPED